MLIALAVVGCGKKGMPLPPEPRGPRPPAEVEVRQIGDEVVVGFVVPAARGEQPAQQPVRAEMIRVAYAPGVAVQADPDTFRRRGQLVMSAEPDPFESGSRVYLTDFSLGELPGAGRGHTVRYGIRVRDRRGRSSALVVAPDLVVVAPIPAPGQLRAEATADGVRLEWEPPTDGQPRFYNVYRDVEAAGGAERPLNAKPLSDTSFLDTDVATGERYTYVVRAAEEEGPPYRESESSERVPITAEDRFPPVAPSGLVAVQEGAAVRLFWNPSAEHDLSGYRVYRRDAATDSAWQRIGPELVAQPLFLDAVVAGEQNLEYRVTAIDRAEPPNESAPSASVVLHTVDEPSVAPPGGP